MLGAALVALAFLPGCAYVAKQAQGQFRLLAGRVPIDKALATVEFTAEERAKLELVPSIKAFGEAQVGLSPTKNYGTINPDFDDVIWNVSGCAPDRFTSHVYRYPVVGALPYIGFFDRADADAEQERLDGLGWETWVRSSGAYSTLGWFKDPLWRSMLRWDREQLVNTVLHELAHATLWLSGEGRFNESWAQFVGDRATELWLAGPGHEDLMQLHEDRAVDGEQYRAFMRALVTRLDGLYGAGFPPEVVLARKQRLLDEARAEYTALPWRLDGYAASMAPDRPLNNARLVQFRVYNAGGTKFRDALSRFDGDLGAFVDASRGLAAQKRREGGAFDPWDALERLGR